jgi:hypothetical protein
VTPLAPSAAARRPGIDVADKGDRSVPDTENPAMTFSPFSAFATLEAY